MRILNFYKFVNESINEYYEEVDIETYQQKKLVLFDSTSIKKMKDLFPSIINCITTPTINIIADSTQKTIPLADYKETDQVTFVSFNNDKYGVDISISADEWYRVSLLKFSIYSGEVMIQDRYQSHYLCDQWVGFVKLLSDKGIINTSS